jgi:hypothetical protein
MRDGISHVTLDQESLPEKSQKNQSMSKLPKKIRGDLNKEAYVWGASIAAETTSTVEQLLVRAKPSEASRPPRQPVSLRMDPLDLAMLSVLPAKMGCLTPRSWPCGSTNALNRRNERETVKSAYANFMQRRPLGFHCICGWQSAEILFW